MTGLFSKGTYIIIYNIILFNIVLFNNSKGVVQVMDNCSIFNTPETEVKIYTILALVTSTVYFLLYPIS